jgi:hypothetical protein
MILDFLASLDPDGKQLLAEISKDVTDDMLQEIALADYGQGEERHLAVLRRLRDAGAIIEPPGWYPCEVLELIRNSEPEDPAWKPGGAGVKGHWMRAFACAAVLQTYGPPWNYTGDPAQPSETLIQLICSLRALPADFVHPAVRMLARLMLDSNLEGEDEQVVYFGIALLWLALHRTPPLNDHKLVALCEWIVRREAELAKQVPESFKSSDKWLIRITAASPPPTPWESLGSDLRNLELGDRQAPLQEWVTLIGNVLAGEAKS